MASAFSVRRGEEGRAEFTVWECEARLLTPHGNQEAGTTNPPIGRH